MNIQCVEDIQFVTMVLTIDGLEVKQNAVIKPIPEGKLDKTHVGCFVIA